jgi:hypothetical protein
MKKLSWFLLLAIVSVACQLQNDEDIVSMQNASGAEIEDYSVTSSTSNSKTFTFNIDINQANKAKDISHIMFNFNDCEGLPLNLSDVTSFKVDGEELLGKSDGKDGLIVKSGTGQGDECLSVSTQNSIKLDEGYNSNIVVVITLDTQSSGGTVYIKAGNTNSGGGCFGPYTFEGDCDDEPCYEYKGETAWTAGTRYVQRGNWATYTAYDGHAKTVNVFAGQTHWAGSADFSTPVDGKVTIKITLNEGWSLKEGDNSVKIQPYTSTPAASNPSPGRFQYKGTSLEIEVDEAAFYGVHLDVVGKREIPCE